MIIPKKEPHYDLFWQVDDDTGYEDIGFNPYSILDEFFSAAKLKEVRQDLWQMLSYAITHKGVRRKEIMTFLYLYERLNDLATASYIIAKEKHLKKR